MSDSLDLASILADVDELDDGGAGIESELNLEAILAEASALELDEQGNIS